MLSEFNKFIDIITVDGIRDLFLIVIGRPIAMVFILASVLAVIGVTLCLRGLLLGKRGTAELGLWIVLITLSFTTTVLLFWRYGWLPHAEDV